MLINEIEAMDETDDSPAEMAAWVMTVIVGVGSSWVWMIMLMTCPHQQNILTTMNTLPSASDEPFTFRPPCSLDTTWVGFDGCL